MHILVTGGAGFIGANFVRTIVRERSGVSVDVLDKISYAANPDSIAGLPGVTLYREELENREVVDELVKKSDLVADRPGHDRRYGVDPTKLMEETGWAPRHTDFEAGLAQTIEWYRAHEDWCRPAKSGAEAQYAAHGQ